MINHEVEPEAVAHQLGAGGVDNLVANAERICDYQQRHIELTNQGTIVALKEEHNQLSEEEHRVEALLHQAPPSGDLRRLRRRAIFCWALTAILTLSGFAFTVLTLAPFQLGLMSCPFATGIAVLTPFLVEKLLENNDILVKVLTAVATAAAVAGLMLLADVRGNMLEQQLRQSQEQAVVIDDSQPTQAPVNDFYDRSTQLLEAAMLLIAFSMEVGAGLALLEARRSSPNSSEDWRALRNELRQIRGRKAVTMRTMVDLHNEPGIFAARFWRDFYRAMLSNAVRSALTKFLILVLAVSICASGHADAGDHLDLVIAIDLTQSVAVKGPDGKSEFQKNVDGVSRVLSQVPAGSRITIIGITDHSFSQPYILLSARTSGEPGYFGERLSMARNQLVQAWKVRSGRLNSNFRHTDVLGALRLADQILAEEPSVAARTLVIFSDMRQNTIELNLESSSNVLQRSLVGARCGPFAYLRNVKVYIEGADGAARTAAYWQSLRIFWENYFRAEKADLKDYSVLREMPLLR
ncbi:MAG TPA: hypothetical protein VK578_14945 [Edaphobacter sp.]|nr:hypothetical protein [Edaphobacter sp.]